jgi:hypothetical protein
MVHSHPQRHGVGHVMMSLVGNPAEEFQTGVEMEKREGWEKRAKQKKKSTTSIGSLNNSSYFRSGSNASPFPRSGRIASKRSGKKEVEDSS